MLSDGSSATGTRLHIPAKYLLDKRKRTEIEKEKKSRSGYALAMACVKRERGGESAILIIRRIYLHIDYQTDIFATFLFH